jgi:hypothetical protein
MGEGAIFEYQKCIVDPTNLARVLADPINIVYSG